MLQALRFLHARERAKNLVQKYPALLTTKHGEAYANPNLEQTRPPNEAYYQRRVVVREGQRQNVG